MSAAQVHIDPWNRHDLDGLMALPADGCVFESLRGDEVNGHSHFEWHLMDQIDSLDVSRLGVTRRLRRG